MYFLTSAVVVIVAHAAFAFIDRRDSLSPAGDRVRLVPVARAHARSPASRAGGPARRTAALRLRVGAPVPRAGGPDQRKTGPDRPVYLRARRPPRGRWQPRSSHGGHADPRDRGSGCQITGTAGEARPAHRPRRDAAGDDHGVKEGGLVQLSLTTIQEGEQAAQNAMAGVHSLLREAGAELPAKIRLESFRQMTRRARLLPERCPTPASASPAPPARLAPPARRRSARRGRRWPPHRPR